MVIDPRSDFPFSACGLDGLSEADKDAFAVDLTAEFELRVGTQLSEGLSSAELEEFARLIDGDDEYCRTWLVQHEPGFQQMPGFIHITAAGHPNPHSEAASMIWLGKHRPDYRDVVTQTWQDLVAECVERFGAED